MTGVGTALPPDSFSQEEVLSGFDVKDRRLRSVFLNGGIERRHLCLPGSAEAGFRPESQAQLLAKHVCMGTAIGGQAIDACLAQIGARREDVRHLCCVSSTGFIIPGFSALLVKELGLSTACSRLDVVGMGCNAGLNALSSVAGWASSHPGELALMVCIEVCSAMYIVDTSMRTAVVNSLFGDGAAAVAVVAGRDGIDDPEHGWCGPKLLRFASCMIPDAIDAMRVDWLQEHGKFSFSLAADVPYVVGAHAEGLIDRLLAGAGLCRGEIAHWIVHSGGKKVIDSVRVNLGLSRGDVRHTLGVLRDCGNLSSASFLFSYERLLREGAAAPGDYGVFMTMGPGSTIEAALAQW
jgi:alkylresorcinol/alkylpyrone synthase/polyketide synthase Type III